MVRKLLVISTKLLKLHLSLEFFLQSEELEAIKIQLNFRSGN